MEKVSNEGNALTRILVVVGLGETGIRHRRNLPKKIHQGLSLVCHAYSQESDKSISVNP